MVSHRDTGRPVARRLAVLALVATSLSLAGLGWWFGTSAVHAQSMMRSPSISISSRAPSISSVGRGGPSISTHAISTHAISAHTISTHTSVATSVGRLGPSARVISPNTSARLGLLEPRLPYQRYSHNRYPGCDDVKRTVDGECNDKTIVIDDGGTGGPGKRVRSNGPRRNNPQATVNLRYFAGEVVVEIDDAQADELARGHRLARIGSQNVALIGSTLNLFRMTDGRSVETVQAELAADARVRSVQPNFRYFLQDQQSVLVPSEGDPAQYALAKLRLPQAHTLAHGANVTVAVIDSGIDAAHPELKGSIADSFDALGSKEGPHAHGTGVAGAIVAHANLMGGAPQARILAIRAFGVASTGAESSSFVILKSLDYAAAHGAQIVNMSFAGPKDPVVERGVAAAASKGIVLVAASGNAGAKSPPLYPAANPNVIAVSATDAQDKLFAPSNRGAHIAIAAPGADIFLPAPDGKYWMTSGTSFSAAYVTSVAALVLERNPALKPEEVRTILTRTARDLGPPGRDDLYGAGEADAYAVVIAAVPGDGAPVARTLEPPGAIPEARKVSVEQAVPVTRALEQPGATMASDKASAQ
jgi:subtilisin family serine protease